MPIPSFIIATIGPALQRSRISNQKLVRCRLGGPGINNISHSSAIGECYIGLGAQGLTTALLPPIPAATGGSPDSRALSVREPARPIIPAMRNFGTFGGPNVACGRLEH